MQLGRNRIEALTDGVFAVAMTLLVLDIKVPELQQPLAASELPLRLLSLWPKFLSYTISFIILGVYSVGHHVQLSFIRRPDRPLLWINILCFGWHSSRFLQRCSVSTQKLGSQSQSMEPTSSRLVSHWRSIGGTQPRNAGMSILKLIQAWSTQRCAER